MHSAARDDPTWDRAALEFLRSDMRPAQADSAPWSAPTSKWAHYESRHHQTAKTNPRCSRSQAPHSKATTGRFHFSHVPGTSSNPNAKARQGRDTCRLSRSPERSAQRPLITSVDGTLRNRPNVRLYSCSCNPQQKLQSSVQCRAPTASASPGKISSPALHQWVGTT
jgi:hypothetical protein